MIDEDLNYDELNELRSSDDERLPKLMREWTTVFGEVSRENPYPAILAYFCLCGQILKDFVRIPYGYTVEDTRIHVCWIQTARSGKTVLNDFFSQIIMKTFEFINATDDKDFDLFDIVEYTDAALIGSTERQPNPERGEEGQPREVDVIIPGALEGSGIALFDEFESSGVFKKHSHKENIITYFQRLMNTLTTDGYLIKKKLKSGPVITCNCQRSMWATTYPPEHLTDVIAEKGVLQRKFLYIRDVPQEILDGMRRELIDSIGETRERAQPTNRFSKAFLNIYNTVKERHEDGVAPENMVTFADGVKPLINLEYDNMIGYLNKVPDNVRKIVSLFETNSLLYITKFAVLCAITETNSRQEDEKWIVQPRNVRQAAWVVRQGYMSLVAWLLQALRTRHSSPSDTIVINDYVNAYHKCDKDDDGWVNKSLLRQMCENAYDIPQAKFYRNWPKVKHAFEERKKGKTAMIKAKGDDE